MKNGYFLLVFSLLISLTLFSSGCASKRHTQQVTRTVQYEVPVQAPVDTDKKIVEKYETRKYKIIEPDVPVDRIGTLRPADFPEDMPWRPKRHFGPFYEGSALENIQIHINGNIHTSGSWAGSVNWYYNNFFDQVDAGAKNIYRLYYRSDFMAPPHTGTLPITPTPTIDHSPGAAPVPASGYVYANDVLLCMKQISYSSRFGGSLKLMTSLCDIHTPNDPMPTIEDVEYEFSDSEYRFDVNQMTVNIYINPKASLFNPKINRDYSINTHVEIIPNEVIAYELPEVKRIDSNVAKSNLDDILKKFEKRVAIALGETGRRPPVSIFGHAYLHNQHKGIIGDNDKVTQIVISDGFSDVWTEQYEPYMYVSFRIRHIYTNHPDAERDNEWVLRQLVDHVTSTDRTEIVARTIESTQTIEDPQGTTRWYAILGKPATRCASFNHLEMTSKITEDDPVHDDVYSPTVADLFLWCNLIKQQAEKTHYTGWVLEPAVLAIVYDDQNKKYESENYNLRYTGYGRLLITQDIHEKGDRETKSVYAWEVRVGIFAR